MEHSFPESEFSDLGSQFAIKSKAVLDNWLPHSPPNKSPSQLDAPRSLWVLEFSISITMEIR